jgi:hypothetical protein
VQNIQATITQQEKCYVSFISRFFMVTSEKQKQNGFKMEASLPWPQDAAAAGLRQRPAASVVTLVQ